MNRLKYTLLLVCFVCFSCDDFLERAPELNLDEDKVFTDFVNAEKFHNDIYTHLKKGFNMVGDWQPVPLASASDEADTPGAGAAGTYMVNNGGYDGFDADISHYYTGIRKANEFSANIYRIPFPDDRTRKMMTGEAYFEVAKDSLRPFYVESGDMTVRVYGTEFNVNAYAEDNRIYTTLVSGSIALQPQGGGKGELVLTPGHQALFHKEDCTVNVRSVDAPAVTSWHEGRFTFEEQTLGQIMRTLSRWYDFDYAFEDARLAGIIFKGSAPRYAELSEVLYILESSGGIGFRVENRKIIITTNNK